MRKIIIAVLILTALAFFSFKGLTGFFILSNEKINEVAPEISFDKMIGDGMLFNVKAIKNPIKEEESFILIQTRACITSVLINGELKWQGRKCGNLAVSYIPKKSGNYFVLVNYEKDGNKIPLQFILNIQPVSKINYLNYKIKINDTNLGNNLTLKAGQEINGEIVLKSSEISAIKKASLIIIGKNYFWIHEILINKQLIPYITFKRTEKFVVPRMAGNYTLLAYLYTEKGAISKIANITIINDS